MTDKTYGIKGVTPVFNSKKLEFDTPYCCWIWVVKYCRKHKYKIPTNKPLCRDIFKQLRAVISPKTVSSRELYNAVGFHVNSIKYLNRIRVGFPRFNLWGKQEGEVTETEVQYARKKLTELHPGYTRARRASRKQGVVINPKLKQRKPANKTSGPRKLTLRGRSET